MDLNNTYVRVHKPPTYYPGMGAYAHLQQQQLNMCATYPKVNYTLPNATRRKSQNQVSTFNTTSNRNNTNNSNGNSNQYYPSHKSNYLTQGKPTRCLLKKLFNFSKLPKILDIFKPSENGNKESKNNNGNDNLDGTYTICTGIPNESNCSNKVHNQQQQSANGGGNSNTRRFINVDKFIMQR